VEDSGEGGAAFEVSLQEDAPRFDALLLLDLVGIKEEEEEGIRRARDSRADTSGTSQQPSPEPAEETAESQPVLDQEADNLEGDIPENNPETLETPEHDSNLLNPLLIVPQLLA